MTDWSFLEKAWTNLINRTSSFVPTMLATVLLLLVGLLVSWLIASLIRRFLVRVRLDRWLDSSDVAESLKQSDLGRSPTQLIARVVFWLFFLCFIVIALENLGLELSQLPIRAFIAYLPVVLGAVLLLLGGVVLATFLGRGTAAALGGMGIEHYGRLGRVVKGLVVALTVVLVVEQLGFDVTTLTRTFSNLVIVIAAGLVFAFAWGGRDVARNVLASHYIREQYRQGDRVVVDGHEGVLEEVGSLNSRLTSEEGEILVPNSRLIEQTVAKKSVARPI